MLDTKDSATLNKFLGMMGQELKYVLMVLSRSTDRSIDLTPALFKSIDVVQEIIYRTMKLMLASGQSK